jgi:hypothetical protein
MDLDTISNRLVNELMLVSVLVAGEGAEAFAAGLSEAGAAADVFGQAGPEASADLAILLAGQAEVAPSETTELVARLSEASDRLLFVPLPATANADPTLPPALQELTAWFEIFAELGYQPVVDFDASFVAAGAFLVDRAATAAESELAAFADRLQTAAPPMPRETAAQPHPELAELQVQIASLAAQAEQAQAALHDAETRNVGWDGLRAWVNAAVRDPSRDTEASLLSDLPRLKTLRGLDAPPIDVFSALQPPKPGWFSRLLGRAPAPPGPGAALRVLQETALVRASKFFDPAWYIASAAELWEGETIDPVFHYVFVGALRDADPGPWFDTAAYRAAHPDATGSGQCALVHALRTGAPEVSAEPGA